MQMLSFIMNHCWIFALIQVVQSGGGSEIWGLYGRWHKLKGDLSMCSEALLKQVRSYQVYFDLADIISCPHILILLTLYLAASLFFPRKMAKKSLRRTPQCLAPCLEGHATSASPALTTRGSRGAPHLAVSPWRTFCAQFKTLQSTSLMSSYKRSTC